MPRSDRNGLASIAHRAKAKREGRCKGHLPTEFLRSILICTPTSSNRRIPLKGRILSKGRSCNYTGKEKKAQYKSTFVLRSPPYFTYEWNKVQERISVIFGETQINNHTYWEVSTRPFHWCTCWKSLKLTKLRTFPVTSLYLKHWE